MNSPKSRRNRSHHPAGLDGWGNPIVLQELVVMTILAILTTVAVVSTETVLQQGRFEATQRALRAIEQAILGPELYRSEDGTLATSGFVADIGRLPIELSELWERPADLPGFDFFPAEDPDVSLPYGWRGPYLRLAVGADQLLDGWGSWDFAIAAVADGDAGDTCLATRWLQDG